MIRTIIIDDEPNAIKALQMELKTFDDVDVLDTFIDARHAIEFLNDNAVDVVFLDMAMPNMSGLQFLDSFNDPDFMVVFCTAHSEFGIPAVKNQAIDYLLKPVDSEDLLDCVEKIREKVESKNSELTITKAVEMLNHLKTMPKKIKIYTEGKIYFLEPEKIIYCEADGSYSHIYLNDVIQKIIVSKRLKNVAEWMPEQHFLRVHNSYIVNVQAISEYYKRENYLVLTNGKVIPISRSRKREIIDKL